jgi:hypothetical protein
MILLPLVDVCSTEEDLLSVLGVGGGGSTGTW